MRDKEDVLIWEHRQMGGDGAATYCEDTDLVGILEQIMPRGFDLDQMASEGEAIRIGKRYLLTSQGYNKFVLEAERQQRCDIVKALNNKKEHYWFRNIAS
jgi:hypothetical protein